MVIGSGPKVVFGSDPGTPQEVARGIEPRPFGYGVVLVVSVLVVLVPARMLGGRGGVFLG